MRSKALPSEIRRIWRIAIVIQSILGLSGGVSMYTWGPLFFEKLSSGSDPHLGITLTTALISLQNILRALLEVPTGAIGDVIGRRWTVALSLACYMLYSVLMSFVAIAHTISWIVPLGIFAVVTYVFHYTFFSGTFTAWCVDSLRERDPNIGYEHILAPSYTANFIANIVGGAFGILLYVEGLVHAAFLGAAFVALVGVLYCIGEMEDERTLQFLDWSKIRFATVTTRMGRIIGTGFHIFRRSPAILALVVIFASFMTVINLVDYLWPVYVRTRVEQDQQTYYWIGLAVSTMLAASAGSHGMTFFTRWWQRGARTTKAQNTSLRHLLIGACIFSACPIILLGQLTTYGKDSFWIFATAVLLIQLAYGLIAPCFETLVNNYIPDSHAQERATILSFGSLGRSLLVMILAIPAGGPSGMQTTIGWAIPAGLLLIVAIIGNFVLRRAQRRVPDIDLGPGLDESQERQNTSQGD